MSCRDASFYPYSRCDSTYCIARGGRFVILYVIMNELAKLLIIVGLLITAVGVGLYVAARTS